MPPLSDTRPTPVLNPARSPAARSMHPSPKYEGLRLEAMSAREQTWWGHRFGIDTPYVGVLTGFGEFIPLYGWDAAEALPEGVFVVAPPSG